MYLNQNLFIIYEIVLKGIVVIRNNASCKVAGIGRVRLKLLDVTIRTLDHVRHTPNLTKNLILLATLNSKEYDFTGGCGALKVCKYVWVVLESRKSLSYTFFKVLQNHWRIIKKGFVTWWIFIWYSIVGIWFGVHMNNTVQSSSMDMDNATLPPSSLMPSYLIVRDIPIEERYDEADFCVYFVYLKVFCLTRDILQKYLVLIPFQGVFQTCLINFKSLLIFGNPR